LEKEAQKILTEAKVDYMLIMQSEGDEPKLIVQGQRYPWEGIEDIKDFAAMHSTAA
jgi:hypothetical protein